MGLPRAGDRARIEQIIYGSFADRPGGYHVRFATPGVSETIVSEVIRRCDNWGEIRDSRFRNSLMTLSLPAHLTGGAGTLTMVDMVANLGIDAAGRTGAQMHHVLVLTAPEYEALAHDPFALVDLGVMRLSWDGNRPEGPIEVQMPSMDAHHAKTLANAERSDLRAAFRIAMRLLDRRKCIFWKEEDSPRMRSVMRAAWVLLPMKLRAAVRVATFAFLNRNDFDLAAVHSDLASQGDDEILFGAEEAEERTSASETTRDYLLRIARALSDEHFEEAVQITHGSDADGEEA